MQQLVSSFSWDHERRANHFRAPKSSPPIALSATMFGSGLATTFVEKEMLSKPSQLAPEPLSALNSNVPVVSA
jgi:hypothetical protein